MKAKAPDLRQGHNNTGVLADKEVVAVENILPPEVPPLPGPLTMLSLEDRAVAKMLWVDIWMMGHGFYRADTDAYTIERYVSMQVRRERLMSMLNDEGFVTIGSQGQQVAHPAARLLLDIEGKLPNLEDRLGLSPEARLRLGLAAAETKSKLDAFMESDD